MTPVIEGSEHFRGTVSGLLGGNGSKGGGIVTNPVGRVILTHIENSRYRVTITPWTGDGENSGTQTDGPADDAHPKGEYYYLDDVKDDPKTLRNERFDKSKSKGTGRGTGAVVKFSTVVPSSSIPTDAEVLLFHELVHALRKLQGLENSMPLDGSALAAYDDTEEWLAITVEDVYRSARNQTVFRGGHDLRTKLEPPEDTSDGFLDNPSHRSLMQRQYRLWRPVFQELSLVRAKFNPFREFTLDPVKYSKGVPGSGGWH
jgi:hypothetical protein